MLTENGVDGVSLCHLTNGDLNLMLPGKVGVARKLTVFIDRLNSDNVLSREPVSNVNQPIASTHTSTEAAVSALPDAHPVPSCSHSQQGIPLPVYSTRIQEVLKKGNVLLDFDLFVEETAYHIIASGDMKTKTEYEEFGRRLLTAYPCLEFPGKKTSWVLYFLFFTSNEAMAVQPLYVFLRPFNCLPML